MVNFVLSILTQWKNKRIRDGSIAGTGGLSCKNPFPPTHIYLYDKGFFFLSLLLKTRTQIRRDHLQKVQDLLFSSLGIEYQPNKITVELESEQHQCILFLKPIILFLKLLCLWAQAQGAQLCPRPVLTSLAALRVELPRPPRRALPN